MQELRTLTLEPIGLVRSPFTDKASAPRQPSAGRGVEGRIELREDHRFTYALEDLDRWSHLWVIFWFHLNDGWRPKVRPPRSVRKRGVFATRSPHRPNPIGLSAVELVGIEGLTLRIRDVDIVDGTPVLDLKPYVPYADAIGAAHGWLADEPDRADAGPEYVVHFSAMALEQLEWLRQHHGIDLRGEVQQALGIGVAPHPYRRIKRDASGMRLALRDWRFRFGVDGRTVTVDRVVTGYRPRVLNDPRSTPSAPTPLDVHRAFVARFG